MSLSVKEKKQKKLKHQRKAVRSDVRLVNDQSSVELRQLAF